jgi:TetR/AcrR family transcriptional repressor of nem operon
MEVLMPRVSKEQTQKNRLAIEEVSSKLFRERGLGNVSVNDLMAAAGLTHGGFYGHFASKDDLAGVACRKAWDQGVARWERRVASAGDRPPLVAVVEGYLTKAHRDAPGDGCILPTLAADVAREAPDRPIREAYAEGLQRFVDILAGLNGGDRPDEQALAQLSTMVGAMVLSRATAGLPISDEILAAARHALLASDA